MSIPPRVLGYERRFYCHSTENFNLEGRWVYVRSVKPTGPLHLYEKYQWSCLEEKWEVITYINWHDTDLFHEIKSAVQRGDLLSWITHNYVQMNVMERKNYKLLRR